MKAFLREYWPWIVVPFVLMGLALALFLFVLSGDQGGSSPFIYNPGG